jgi:uncharacterized protein (DUF488 family)
MNPVYTVGHSNHPETVFLDLLRSQQIEAIADVRSAPYSRYNPQFDRETLKASLKDAGIQYAWLGKELGARSDDPACYLYGKVQYARLAETELFQSGVARVMDGARSRRVALLCAEKEPLECHRFVLVARWLVASGAEVRHLHADGLVESHEDAMERLLKLHGMGPDLFRSTGQLYEDAYRMQEGRIAYDSAAAADASAA